MNPRVVVLLRCSTSNQDLDFAAQRATVKEWLVRAGLDVRPDDWREEPAVSGARRRRPVLDRIIREADAGEITHVVCADFDRAGRSGFRTCAMVEDLVEDSGVTVVFVREGLVLSMPLAFKDRAYMAAMSIGGMAKLEATGNASKAGVAVAKARGRAVGAAPFGTRWDGHPATVDPVTRRRTSHPATLVPVDEELATLRRALALRENLRRWDLAAAALTTEGRLTRKGRPWIAWKLARACRNPRVRMFLVGWSG
jgi:DNA invertase Pin-like site-specific DNA recombinase